MKLWPQKMEVAAAASIVKCGLDDQHQLRRIGQETYADAFSSMNSSATMDAYLREAFSAEKIQSELQTSSSAFYFLQAKGALAGYLKVNLPPAQSDLNDPGTIEIERIYVVRDYQGGGLGRGLLEAAERIGAAMGCGAAWLGVWEKNVRAIGFYRRMGYSEVGRHSFRMGDEVQSDLIMKKTWKHDGLSA